MRNKIDINDEQVLRDLALLAYDAHMAAFTAFHNEHLPPWWTPWEDLGEGQQYAWVQTSDFLIRTAPMLSDGEVRQLERAIERAVYAALERQRKEEFERLASKEARKLEIAIKQLELSMNRAEETHYQRHITFGF